MRSHRPSGPQDTRKPPFVGGFLFRSEPASGLNAPASIAVFVNHLQEKQVGELLPIIAVGNAVVAEDVTVVSGALNN